MPVGNAPPICDQLYCPVPPDAVRLNVYDAPMTGSGGSADDAASAALNTAVTLYGLPMFSTSGLLVTLVSPIHRSNTALPDAAAVSVMELFLLTNAPFV